MAPTNDPAPLGPGPFPVQIPADTSNSLWDRLSNWASENKGVVYTIAGITLVVGAGGAVYYFSNDSRGDGGADTAANKRKKQRERKREKERAKKDSSPEKSSTTAGM
jgi:import receptor subunit TOM70